MRAASCAPPMQASGVVAFGPQIAGQGHREEGRQVDKQLWLACAGPMCTVPPVGAAVYYFPQGHAEQASAAVDFSSGADGLLPPLVLCRVDAVQYMADPGTDEVFAKMRLVPLHPGAPVADEGEAAAESAAAMMPGEQKNKPPASFTKTLSQSDTNNIGEFYVPRFWAETIFPALDLSAKVSKQSLVVRDVHGRVWTFLHVYRNTLRHVLTTGWSYFVYQKKLLAGDSIVFFCGEDGQVHIGIRRAKRAATVFPSGWDLYGRGLVPRARSSGSTSGGSAAAGNLPPDDVVVAARLAAVGEPFEVVHYPRATLHEFCVRAAAVKMAMQVQWCPGMRFKMAFETKDSSRIKWFMGTVAAVQPDDPALWPQSPWRLLQVTWDKAELLQNVKRVCPWLAELPSSMPIVHQPPFSPPKKRPRIPLYTDALYVDPAAAGFLPHHHPPPPTPIRHYDQDVLPFPESSAAAGIQGARQAQFTSSFSELHIRNLQQGLLPSVIRVPPTIQAPPRITTDLTIGNLPPAHQDALSSDGAKRKANDEDDVKPPPPGIKIFGTMLTGADQRRF